MTAPSRGESGLPLIAEALPGFEYTVWYGVFAPPRTPGVIVDKLNAAIRAVVADPELQKKLEAQSLDLQASTPDELTAHMRKESAKWEKVVREANVTME
jgi:tripartite-type tricarboxylate transporter receptor subunit TctC